MKKSIGVFAAAVFAAAALTACGGNEKETTAAPDTTEAATEAGSEEATEKETEKTEEESEETEAAGNLEEIVLGASPAPHAEILREANKVLAQKGYEQKILEYVDYIQPNLALEAGDLDANYFQHLP